MENFKHKYKNRKWAWFFAGILIIGAGKLMLLERMGWLIIPEWAFSWKTLLIALGLFNGISSKFRGFGWMIMIIIGSVFLLQDNLGIELNIREYIWPIAIILIGTFIMLKALFRKPCDDNYCDTHFNHWKHYKKGQNTCNTPEGIPATEISDDEIRIETVCGGVKKKFFTKNFKGGHVTNIMGGTELDLSQSDIESTATLYIDQVFGGIKIIAPANWNIQTNVTSILSGVEDRRKSNNANNESQKILKIVGTSVLGGIDIKSF